MLTIRLQRVGKKNQAAFRIVLAEKQRAVKKQVVEILGHYNPRSKEFGIKDPERLKYWVQQHVEISPTVHNLLIDKGLVAGSKVKAWKPKKRPPADRAGEAGKSADSSVAASAKAEVSTKAEKQASEQQAAAVAELKAEEKPVEAKAVTETKEEAKSTKPAEAPAAGASAPVAGTKEEPPPAGN